MFKFSRRSKDKLEGVHPDLLKVLNEAIKHVDFTVLEGLRDLERQGELVRQGKSKTMNSKHLKHPDGYGHAVDIAPYPIDWDNKERFVYLGGYIRAVGHSMGIEVTWGGDWDSDFNTKDHSFFDGPHFQLKVKK